MRWSILVLYAASLCTGCATFMKATTRGPIEDDPHERTIGATIDDQTIEAKVEVNIGRADKAFKKAHITAISHNGKVLLIGEVQSARLKSLAGEVAGRVNRVRTVHNELEIAGPISFVSRSNDAMLSSEVKLRLLRDSKIPGRNINVSTENGVVYLMGMVTREEGNRAALLSSAVTGVQKVVKVFEYIE